jgi:hypothetical protein
MKVKRNWTLKVKYDKGFRGKGLNPHYLED